jgi:hypothetical protein
MQLGSSIDSFPCFTRLNPCVAHCSIDSKPWVHHSREEESLDYDGGFVRLQIHMNFDTIIYRQHQVHVATGVLLNLGTNFQPHIPENVVEHQRRVH